jgi:hypothetical protein
MGGGGHGEVGEKQQVEGDPFRASVWAEDERKVDRRLNPDLPRGRVNLIGGELDVDDPRL